MKTFFHQNHTPLQEESRDDNTVHFRTAASTRCCKGKWGRRNILTRYHRYLEWKTSRSVHRRLWRNITSFGSEAIRKVMQPLRLVLQFKKLTGCMTIQNFHLRRTKNMTTEASLQAPGTISENMLANVM